MLENNKESKLFYWMADTTNLPNNQIYRIIWDRVSGFGYSKN